MYGWGVPIGLEAFQEAVEVFVRCRIAGDNENGVIARQRTENEFRTPIVDVVRYGVRKARTGFHYGELPAEIKAADRHLRKVGVDTKHFLLYHGVGWYYILHRAVLQHFFLRTQVAQVAAQRGLCYLVVLLFQGVEQLFLTGDNLCREYTGNGTQPASTNVHIRSNGVIVLYLSVLLYSK